MKRTTSILILSFITALVLFTVIKVPTINVVYALEDNVGSRVNVQQQPQTQPQTQQSQGLLQEIADSNLDPRTQEVSDWFKDQGGVTAGQLQTASDIVSPITNIIGYAVGIIIVLTLAGVSLITALDLMYIGIPPIRNVLYKAGTDGTGGYTGGFGAGGYGRTMGGMGAMGAGGAAGGTRKPTQWVSDEAVACASLLGGSAQTGNMMAGPMGMGGHMGMGGMSMAQQAGQGNMTTKSVIGLYLKKRIFFLVLLAVCLIVLTSSIIMDCGINLATWFLKILNVINGRIG